MAYLPDRQYDLYISYAAENNRNGWVDRFSDALTSELEELLGRPFSRESVFFDRSNLRVGQSFSAELERAISNSALMIAIVSPSYLDSDWCKKELQAFVTALSKEAGIERRLCPIVVRPVAEKSLPDLFRTLQSFSFLEPGTEQPVSPDSPEWAVRIARLAAQLKAALHNLRHSAEVRQEDLSDKPPRGRQPQDAPVVTAAAQKTEAMSEAAPADLKDPPPGPQENERVSARADDPARVDELGRRPFADLQAPSNSV